MWKAIYVAADQAQADKMSEMLGNEGFLARVQSVVYGEDKAFEIQVPEAESEDAQAIVCDMGGEL